MGNVVFSGHTYQANHKSQHRMRETTRFLDSTFFNQGAAFKLPAVLLALTEASHNE
jgi:hypothetical protein